MELFAGEANVWRAVSEAGFPAARADLTDCAADPSMCKQNPMDILSSAGFAHPGFTRLRGLNHEC